MNARSAGRELAFRGGANASRCRGPSALAGFMSRSEHSTRPAILASRVRHRQRINSAAFLGLLSDGPERADTTIAPHLGRATAGRSGAASREGDARQSCPDSDPAMQAVMAIL